MSQGPGPRGLATAAGTEVLPSEPDREGQELWSTWPPSAWFDRSFALVPEDLDIAFQVWRTTALPLPSPFPPLVPRLAPIRLSHLM